MVGTVKARRWMGWAMAALLVLSLLAWYLTRERLPAEIRIATAAPGGLYHKFGQALKPGLERAAGRPVRLIETRGSAENRDKLLAGEADLCILQAGSVPSEGTVALAPLFLDIVQVVARKGRGIRTPCDLAGKMVSLGPPGSGMRESALRILEHYRVPVEKLGQTETYFDALASDPKMDAAIVTTGILNPDLARLLESGNFELIPILDAEALSVRQPCFLPASIPRGLYGEGPAMPPEPVPTIATTAFLAAREGAPRILVSAALEALYGNPLQNEIPTLIPKRKAAEWHAWPWHPEARGYFDPYEGIGLFSDFMQSLAAIKELIFAFAAALYLAWDRWRRWKERESEAELQALKDRLDAFLEETVKIERAQMETDDPAVLRGYLDQITRIKLRALEELTHESLRGDRMFSIFLVQCANVIQRIQAKTIFKMQAGEKGDRPPAPSKK